MDAINRYLHAIEIWLPKEQKKDIIAEICEDLRSKIEEQERILGRNLRSNEVEALLEKRGSPLAVAQCYLPQQYLIGPLLFPVYMLVLKWCLFAGLPLLLLSLLLAPVQNVVGSLWRFGFQLIGTVTAAFAILQVIEKRSRFLERFSVKKLPRVQLPGAVSRPTSAFEIVMSVVLLVWWCVYATSSPSILGVHFQLRAIWAYFFWSVIALTIANAALSLANLRRPYWTTPRAVLRAILDLAGGLLFLWFCKADVIVAASNAQFERLIKFWLGTLFPYAALVVAIVLAFNTYRIYRVRDGADALHSCA